MKLSNLPLKAVYACDHHDILWQQVPQINCELSKLSTITTTYFFTKLLKGPKCFSLASQNKCFSHVLITPFQFCYSIIFWWTESCERPKTDKTSESPTSHVSGVPAKGFQEASAENDPLPEALESHCQSRRHCWANSTFIWLPPQGCLPSNSKMGFLYL